MDQRFRRHIQELRAELRGCYMTRQERIAVERELAAALARQAERECMFGAALAAEWEPGRAAP
ncbi:MAG: hypothetical protein ACREHV_14265 [Rhizomicrobium sp.]